MKTNQKTLADEKVKQDPKAVENIKAKTPVFQRDLPYIQTNESSEVLKENSNFTPSENKDQTIFKQFGVIFDKNWKPIGSYNWVAPKPVDPKTKLIIKAVPLDGNGKPRFSMSLPYVMVDDGKGNRGYKQNSCLYDFKGRFVSIAEKVVK